MLALALTGVAASAFAAEAPGARLFEQKRCYICHETDKVSLGPPLKAIAGRRQLGPGAHGAQPVGDTGGGAGDG
jgi:cytochrome c551/c552